MEIAVCLKRVPDTAEADVKVDASGKDIVQDKLAFTINEADNYALEEALLAKEKHNANVTLVSVGPKPTEEVLRMGLAKGGTAAARIDSEGIGEADGIGLAQVLAAWFKGKTFDLILTGAIASDDGNSQVRTAGPAARGLCDGARYPDRQGGGEARARGRVPRGEGTGHPVRGYDPDRR